MRHANAVTARLALACQPVFEATPEPGTPLRFLCPNPVTLWRARTLLTKEPDTIKWIGSFGPGTVLFDVGANIGTHTVTLAGNSLQVHAFEPQRRVFEILSRNIAKFDNVVAHNVAADNAPGTARMKAPTKNVGATEMAIDGTGEVITCIRIDDLAFPAPVGFMKIDVEKHEMEALAGALETVERDRPVIIMEDQVHARNLLAPLGYRCRRIALVDFLCLPG